jgi:hypothetical protein
MASMAMQYALMMRFRQRSGLCEEPSPPSDAVAPVPAREQDDCNATMVDQVDKQDRFRDNLISPA